MPNQQLPLFPTTVVGSMPRSDFVRDLLTLESETQRSEIDTQKEMDAAVQYIIALQEAAGIDIISDGEWRRRSYIGVIADIASGFELSMHEEMHWTTAVDKIRLKQPGGYRSGGGISAAAHRSTDKGVPPVPVSIGTADVGSGKIAGRLPDTRGVHV